MHLTYQSSFPILITGAFRGIGWSLAQTFAKAQRPLVLTYRTQRPEIDSQIEELKRMGAPQVEAFPLDFSQPDSLTSFLKNISEIIFSAFISNAGETHDQLVLRLSVEQVQQTWQSHFLGPYAITQQILRKMLRQNHGSLIYMSSVVASLGNPGQVAYGSSKAALEGLVHSLSREIASRKITVNAIAPGFIETDMTAGLSPDQKEKLLNAIPLARYGTPEEVSSLAAFLISDQARYITGQVLHINGGMLMS